MRRLLLVVNVLIAIAVIASAGAFYWVFYRALPPTSGSVETTVSQPAEISRDGLGVPHIKASTLEDALYAQGYATAGDRLWQMDVLRRQAAGELSEVFGSSTLAADREQRPLRLRRIAEQVYTQLPPADKAVLAAYARGVNGWIATRHGRYGVEFTLIGYDPKPWSVIDSLLVGLNMFGKLTNTWQTKLIKESMLHSGEPDKVKYLFADRAGVEILSGGDMHPGSNAWVISGKHSASGKPLLSNDMHLEFAIPSIWHSVQVEAPGLNVAGVTLPGLPGVISGHNDRIAWGMTNLGFDVQDLYLEKIDLKTGQYVFDGHVEQARAERELIFVKGAAASEITTWITRHGPVMQSQQTSGRPIAMRWPASDPQLTTYMFLDLNRARNWEEFKTALSRFGGPGQNFVYADVDGNIGYHAAGKLPIRRNYQGDVPVDGSTSQSEWDGYIPFDELPAAFNPSGGVIATANQNPFPANYAYKASGQYAAPWRAKQIMDLIAAGGDKLRPEDNLRIQKDVYSAFDHFLARQIAAAYKKRGTSNRDFDDAASLLSQWDGQMDKEHPQPLITVLVFDYLRKAAANRAAPGSGDAYQTQLSSAVIDKLLRERPADWFVNYDELLLRCFADAMEEGRRLQGNDVKKWRWGRSLFVDVKHPVLGNFRWVGSYFNTGAWPMSGSSTTVKQTSGSIHPSERMNLSLGNWDDSLLNLTFGESGNRASWHYRDQFDAWYYGASFPMPFSPAKDRSTLKLIPGQ